MGSASDIRAGKAYIEIYGKDLYSKVLKAAENGLRSLGRMATEIGSKLSLVGAVVTTPLLAMAHAWSGLGEQLMNLSKETGMTVESVSALKRIAEDTGVSMDAVSGGVRKMQRFLISAAEGSKEAQSRLVGLGLSLKELMQLSPEKQFDRFADAIDAIPNPTVKAAIAMDVFGKSGTALLPVLEGGSAQMRKTRTELEELGLVMSSETAAKAAALDDAFDRLGGVLGGLRNALAGAIAPVVTGISQAITQSIASVNRWIKAHSDLIAKVFTAGAALGGLGTALLIAGKAFDVAAGLIHGVKNAMTAFKVVTVPLQIAAGVISTAWTAAAGVLGLAWSGISLAVGAATTTITTAMSVIGGAATAINTFVAAAGTLAGALASVGSVIAGLATGIAGAFSTAIAALPAILVGAIVAELLYISDQVFHWSDSLSTSVQGGFQRMAGATKEVFSSIATEASNQFSAIVSSARNLAVRAMEVFHGIWADIRAGFQHLRSDADGLFDAIQAALESGRIQQALTVLISFARVEWARLKIWFTESFGTIDEIWDKLKAGFRSVCDYLEEAWIDVWAGVQSAAVRVLAAIKGAIAEARQLDPSYKLREVQAATAKAMVPDEKDVQAKRKLTFGLAGSKEEEEKARESARIQREAIDQQFGIVKPEVFQSDLEKQLAAIETERKNRLAALKKPKETTASDQPSGAKPTGPSVEELEGLRRQQEVNALHDDLEQAQKDLASSKAAARNQTEVTIGGTKYSFGAIPGEAKPLGMTPEEVGRQFSNRNSGLEGLAVKTSTTGTFSDRVAASFGGGGGAAEQTAKNTATMATQLKNAMILAHQIHTALKNSNPAFGNG